MNKCIIQRDDIMECLIKTKRLKIYEASDKDVDMIIEIEAHPEKFQA